MARNNDPYSPFEHDNQPDEIEETDDLEDFDEEQPVAEEGSFEAQDGLDDEAMEMMDVPDTAEGDDWQDWAADSGDDEAADPGVYAPAYPSPFSPRATRKVPALHTLDVAYDEHGKVVGMTTVARTPAVRPSAPLEPLSEDSAKVQTVFIRGSGVPTVSPFSRRRRRTLTLRIAAICIVVAIALTAVFTVTPLANLASQPISAFQGLTGAVLAGNGNVSFIWYTAKPGDTPESIAQSFHIQLGGFYELNNFYQGEEIKVGEQYKIPTDPNYGEGYVPPSPVNANEPNYGNTRYGPNWWDSIAGNPSQAAPCAPGGNLADPLGYHLISPNWNSIWIRGFIVYGTWVYHTGVDLAAPQGNPIHAAQAGQVIWAGYDGTNGLGWSVKIDHCNHVSTVYGHMLQVFVHAGEYVDVGTVIGLEGSTGNSTGPHLHFMVEVNNLWVDPMLFYTSQYTISHYVPS